MIQEVTSRTEGGLGPTAGAVAPQMTLDGQLASGIAEFLDLLVELCGISYAFVPAPVQVADVRVDDMRPLQALGDDIISGAGVDQLADGGLVQPELPADRRLRHPLRPQLVGGGMLLPQPGHDLQLLRRLHHIGLRFRVAGAVFRSGKRFCQAGAVGVDRLLNRLAEVGPQVVPVRDLLGLWRPDPRALPG
ncbi:hypothetical protein ACQEV4_11855 [Streptomyces shenzhenensis]|uniref:hypothetical protein n=1 Tax=Streptomyces shenzhenensis TaxID=943815 RepID=UPI003D92AD4E